MVTISSETWLKGVTALQDVPLVKVKESARNLVAEMVIFFQSIGAEELLQSPLKQSIDLIERDIARLQSCDLQDWSEQRTHLAKILKAKVALLRVIEKTADAAAVSWSAV
jgi:hypothetical protein